MMKPGIRRVRNRSAVADVFIVVEEARGSSANSLSVFGIVGIRKNESRMTMMQPTRKQRLDDPEHAADHLVGERRLLEQRLLVVEALDHDRERDRRGDEHDPEAEHDRVLVRELRSSSAAR